MSAGEFPHSHAAYWIESSAVIGKSGKPSAKICGRTFKTNLKTYPPWEKSSWAVGPNSNRDNLDKTKLMRDFLKLI